MSAPAATLTARDGLPTPARYWSMLTIILGITLSVLDGTIVNLALPSITREIHATASQAVWVVNAYLIATLALLLPCAMLGDLYGYRRVYISGLLLFTVSSAACMMADSLLFLAMARVVQGLGAAGILAVGPALVRLTYPRSLLGRGVALNSMMVALASVSGPSVAAAILSIASWHWLFALNVPLGLAVLALGSRTLPHNTAARPVGVRVSMLDVALNAAMFSLVFLGADALLTRAGSDVSSLPRSYALGLLVSGLVIGAVFVYRQSRLAVPMLPIDLLRIPVFALSMCSSIGAFAAQTLAYIGLPFLLLDTYGRTHIEAGLLITAWPLTIVVTAPFVGRLIGRYSDGLLGGLGMVTMAVGLALLALLPEAPSDFDITWRMVVCGIGFALFQAPNNHTIVSSPPAHRSGAASGMLGTARLTGQTVGAVLLALIFSVTDAHDGRGPLMALALGAGLALVAAAFSTLRVKHPLATEKH